MIAAKQRRLKRQRCFVTWGLVPAESLTHDPERNRNGDEEQTKTHGASPAKPRAISAPMFQAIFVVTVEAIMIL